MIIPVRCYSCGKTVGHLYEKYQELLSRDYTEAEALDELKLSRYCCRRMIMTHIDLVDDLIPYSVAVAGTMHQLSSSTTSGGRPSATPNRPSAAAKTS